MNQSQTNSDGTPGRSRFGTLLAVGPVVALVVGVFTMSGLHTAADAGHDSAPPVVNTELAPPALPPATPPTIDAVPTVQDMELLIYQPHGG